MAFAPDSPLARLMAGPMRPGRVTWIGLRPARRAPVEVVTRAMLIAAEDIAAIASFLGCGAIDPAPLRRNIVTEGINLVALKQRRFRLGEALLETTADCAPCSRMEETFGPGGYNAVRGHGGICARVIAGGEVTLGDIVLRVET